MKEARRLAVGVTPEPDFDQVVNEEFRKIGWTDEEIEARRSRTDAIIRESIETRRTAPEEHLQNLMFQRIETERMIAIAEDIAAQRISALGLSDSEAERRTHEERIQLTAGLPQKLTEVRGEIAATSALMNHPDMSGLSLQQGFEAGIGFDQVWVNLDNDERVEEIVIVEAKGPGARLRDTRTKGFQMSAEWVVHTARQMVRSGDTGVGTALINAIDEGRPRIRGLVVTALKDGSAPNVNIAPGTRPPEGYYDLDELRQLMRSA